MGLGSRRWLRRVGDGPDDRGCPAPGGVDLDEITDAQVVAAARLYLAVDGHVAGLNEFAGLGTVLGKGGELDELAELDLPAHGDRRGGHREVLSLRGERITRALVDQQYPWREIHSVRRSGERSQRRYRC